MTTSFDFKVPSAAGTFNAQALPNYICSEQTPGELLDVKSTLQALASPENAGANRQKLYLRDIEQYLANPVAPEERVPLDIIEGKWRSGFGISVIKAEDGGKPAYLFAVEDKVQKKLVVLGDADIGTDLNAELEKGGVTYFCRSHPRAATAVNDFLATGAYVRAKENEFDRADRAAQTVIESIIKGFSGLCAIAPAEYLCVKKGTTLGAVMKNATAEPVAYVSIIKPKM